jgi:hypothetical protein
MVTVAVGARPMRVPVPLVVPVMAGLAFVAAVVIVRTRPHVIVVIVSVADVAGPSLGCGHAPRRRAGTALAPG